jgi:hypothetical protein
MTVSNKQSQDGTGFVTAEQPINIRRNKTSSILTAWKRSSKTWYVKYFILYRQNLPYSIFLSLYFIQKS